ncbi:MAG: hypothetical protein COA84_05075 [Robiginitomaculum sp.]|nr:MAG: hypothetical protein COA84_05075 [Robiginitomaculum sp.]
MTTETITKFSFGTEFAADGTILRDGENWRQSFTREETEAECEKAYARGRDDVLVKTEEAALQTVQTLSGQCTQILSTLKSQSDACRTQAMELVLVAARKIAGQALEQFPDAQVEDTVREVLKDLRSAPRLVVTCPNTVSDSLTHKLQDMAAQSAFDGALEVRLDEQAAAGDVNLEWAQGEVCITTEDIAQRVEKTIRQWLAATEEQEAQRDLFAQNDDGDDQVEGQ